MKKNYEMPTEAFSHIYNAVLAVIDDLTSAPELLQDSNFRELCGDLHVAASTAGHMTYRIGDKETASDIVKACNKLAELANL